MSDFVAAIDMNTGESFNMEQLSDENERLKAKIKQLHKDYGCELKDPNGTIWEYAEKLKIENDRFKMMQEEFIYLEDNPSEYGAMKEQIEDLESQLAKAVGMVEKSGKLENSDLNYCDFCEEKCIVKDDEFDDFGDCKQAIDKFLKAEDK